MTRLPWGDELVVTTVAVGRGPVEVADLRAADGVDAAPLVFLHEGLGSLRLWRSFPWEVHAATGRRTVVFSRHGYGGSAVVPEPRPTTYMHHEAHEVLPVLLDRLDVRAPVLVGHSDGASIALLYAGEDALADPTAVAVLAPHVVVEDESIAGIAAAREAYATTDLRDRLARHHADVDATFRGWNDVWLSDDFRAWDITEWLPGITCPVLAAQGRDDQYGTLHQLDLLAAGLAGPLTRVEVDDCGHSPHLEQPDVTRGALLDWLAGLA